MGKLAMINRHLEGEQDRLDQERMTLALKKSYHSLPPYIPTSSVSSCDGARGGLVKRKDHTEVDLDPKEAT